MISIMHEVVNLQTALIANKCHIFGGRACLVTGSGEAVETGEVAFLARSDIAIVFDNMSGCLQEVIPLRWT